MTVAAGHQRGERLLHGLCPNLVVLGRLFSGKFFAPPGQAASLQTAFVTNSAANWCESRSKRRKAHTLSSRRRSGLPNARDLVVQKLIDAIVGVQLI
jgi:hypothetical protein